MMTFAVADIARRMSHLTGGDFLMDWIPVTERLPDKNGKYLCSIQSNFKRKKIMRISTTDFESGINRWSPDCMAFKDRVIAWMPLPEPYHEPRKSTRS